MTTIAWDGKRLAGDKQRSWNSTPLAVTKVFRLEHPMTIGNVPEVVLFGCAGDSPSIIHFERFARHGGDKPVMTDMNVLLVDAHGACWAGGHELAFTPVGLRHFAVGSGADFAIGAMARGATAREALDIAATYDTNTGMGVDVLELEA
jgi:hypothetical protein